MGTEQNLDPLFRLTGLSTKDLAETLAGNPRAYMALKGAVAEKHLSLHLQSLVSQKVFRSFRCGSGDFEKDFYVQTLDGDREIVIECKNVQVITTSNNASKREYLEFLKRNKYLDGHAIESAEWLSATTGDLKRAFESLPLELRESGLSRYSFSRNICKVGDGARLSNATVEAYLRRFERYPITIDFQRTRNSRDSDEGDAKANRFYQCDEVDVVAACLFSRTLEWEFIYCCTKNLVRHARYPDRYSNSVKIDPLLWKASLLEALTGK